MTQEHQIRWLKLIMFSGFAIFMLGHFLWAFADLPQKMGVPGILIVAGCCTFGLILSLPTKIYLTILLMRWENNDE
ncbi:hypothetical protein [Arsukibacterium sp.]|uniref:hypothetical protein n=1 Tax=Arsukibacterium sp. TaxID=1977258 RepID=UPI002FD97432